jgi:phosphopantetheinyl transferase
MLWTYEAWDEREALRARAILSVCTDDLPALMAALDTFLCGEERQRLAPIVSDRRRLSFLRGRRAAKNALVRGYGGQAQQWVITSTVFGEPIAQCLGAVNLPARVSISHSDRGALAIAVPAAWPAAVDCEIVSQRNLSAIQGQLSGDEIAAARSQTAVSYMTALTMLWSLKESASKLLGAGLAVDFSMLAMTEMVFFPDQRLEARFRYLAHIQGQALHRGGQVASLVFPSTGRLTAVPHRPLERELAALCAQADLTPQFVELMA